MICTIALSILLLQISTTLAQQACGCANTTAVCGRGNTCKDNACQPLILPKLPAGVLDGTPACLRGAGECCGSGGFCQTGQVCEMNACVDPASCPKAAKPCDKNPCAEDEYCVNDAGSATSFTCEKATPCGCANPTAVCGAGKTCKANKCQPLPTVTLPVGVLDGTPGCVRSGSECCGAGWSCTSGQVCQDDQCIDANQCPTSSKTCASKPCAEGETCIDRPVQCVTAPCPQYQCEKATEARACDAMPCAPDQICVEEPKVCKTTPCPQFRCDAVKMCGCVAPSVKCDSGMTCKDNKCQPMPAVKLPAGVLDGTPACLRGGGDCCGAGASCSADQVCESNQCVAASQCPKAGTCYTCKTAGIKSYFDGCNTCTCGENGDAACTLKACAAVATAAKYCTGKCDGFLTEDDGACGRCTCINGQKTACSKAGTKECTGVDGNRLDEAGAASSGITMAGAMMIVVSISSML